MITDLHRPSKLSRSSWRNDSTQERDRSAISIVRERWLSSVSFSPFLLESASSGWFSHHIPHAFSPCREPLWRLRSIGQSFTYFPFLLPSFHLDVLARTRYFLLSPLSTHPLRFRILMLLRPSTRYTVQSRATPPSLSDVRQSCEHQPVPQRKTHR
jgi:hypothetical protein